MLVMCPWRIASTLADSGGARCKTSCCHKRLKCSPLIAAAHECSQHCGCFFHSSAMTLTCALHRRQPSLSCAARASPLLPFAASQHVPDSPAAVQLLPFGCLHRGPSVALPRTRQGTEIRKFCGGMPPCDLLPSGPFVHRVSPRYPWGTRGGGRLWWLTEVN